MKLKRVFIITGDASGDLHASHVIKQFQKKFPSVEIRAIGGSRMAATGVSIFHDQRHLGAFGMGVLTAIPSHYRLGSRLLKFLQTEWIPDLVLMVDYGIFNLWLAPKIKAMGIPVVYFIPPQIWASRRGRIKQIQKGVDKVCCIFPFEKAIYEEAGVSAVFVGHPVAEELPPAPNRAEFCRKFGLDCDRPIIGLFPGSRRGEVKSLLPSMLSAIPLISERMSERPQFILAQSDAVPDELVVSILRKYSALLAQYDFTRMLHANYAILALSRTAIVASGTVTLESALYQTPVVITYQLSKIAQYLFKRFSYVQYVGLPNLLIPGAKAFLPELIMSHIPAESIASAVEPFLSDTASYLHARDSMKQIKMMMDVKAPASENVVNALIQYFDDQDSRVCVSSEAQSNLEVSKIAAQWKDLRLFGKG